MFSTGNGRSRLLALLTHQLDKVELRGRPRLAGAQPASQKRGPAELLLKRLAGCIDRGLAVSHDALEQVGLYARDLQAVDGLLRPSDEATGEEREARRRIFQLTSWTWSVGSRVPKATNAVSMAIATPACGSCGKVQR